jgi:hypothetical protein
MKFEILFEVVEARISNVGAVKEAQTGAVE